MSMNYHNESLMRKVAILTSNIFLLISLFVLLLSVLSALAAIYPKETSRRNYKNDSHATLGESASSNTGKQLKIDDDVKNVTGCPLSNDWFLSINESLYLPDCSKVTCLNIGGSNRLVGKRCSHSTATIPKSCKIVNRKNGPFPKCCEIVLECEKVVSKVVPVVYTSDDTTTENEDVKERSLDSPQSNLNEKVFSDRKDRESYAKTSRTDEILQASTIKPVSNDDSRSKRDATKRNFASIERESPSGDTVSKESLQMIRIFKLPATFAELLQIPDFRRNIKLLKSLTKYHNSSGTNLGNDSNAFNSKFTNVKPISFISKQKQLALKTKTENISAASQPSGCYSSFGSLRINQTMSLPSCGLLKCIQTKDGSSLITKKCKKHKDIPKNCHRLKNDLKRDFPSCCEVVLLCEMLVPMKIPISNEQKENESSTLVTKESKPFNRNANSTRENQTEELKTVDQPTLIANANGSSSSSIDSSSSDKTPTSESNITSLSRDKRETSSNIPRNVENNETKMDDGKLNPTGISSEIYKRDEGSSKATDFVGTTTKNAEKPVAHSGGFAGCSINSRRIEVNQTIQTMSCGQLKCIENNTIVLTRCTVPSKNIPRNCFLAPLPSKLPFPKCCKMVLVCKEVSKSVQPVAKVATEKVTRVNDSEMNDSSDKHNSVNVTTASSNMQLDRGEKSISFHKSPISGSANASNLQQTSSKTSNEPYNSKSDTRNKRAIGEQQRDGSLKSIESCKLKSRLLNVNETIAMPGCRQLKCIETEKSVALVIVGCDLSSVKPPGNCIAVPQPQMPYPRCCQVVFMCEKIAPIPVPASNEQTERYAKMISMLQSKRMDKKLFSGEQFQNSQNPVFGNQNFVNMNSTVIFQNMGKKFRQFTPLLKLDILSTNRSENKLLTTNPIKSFTVHANLHKGNTLKTKTDKYDFTGGRKKINVTGLLDNLKNRKNRMEDKTHVANVSGNGRLLNTDDSIIPSTTFAESRETGFSSELTLSTARTSTKATKKNINLELNSHENPGFFTTTAKNDDTSTISRRKRAKRNARFSLTRDQIVPREITRGCWFNSQKLETNQTVLLDGCKQLKCTYNYTSGLFAIILNRCVYSPSDLPERCHVKASQEPIFPMCCDFTIECKDTLTFIKPLNHSKYQTAQKKLSIISESINLSSNLKSKAIGVRPSDSLETAHKTNNNIPIDNPVNEDDQLLLSDVNSHPFQTTLISSSYAKVKVENMNNKNESFPEAKTHISKEGTVEMQNVSNNEQNLKSGDINVDVDKNEKKNFSAVKNDTTPKYVSTQNDSAKDSLSMSDELIPLEKKRNGSNINSAELSKTETRGARVKRNTKGCYTRRGFLAADETISMRGCGELRCINEKDEYNLVLISCGPSKRNAPIGCSINQTAPKPYPECCKIQYSCDKVALTLFPVVYSDVNGSIFESKENQRGNFEGESGNNNTAKLQNEANDNGKANSRRSKFDYRTFIARSQKIVKPTKQTVRNPIALVSLLENESTIASDINAVAASTPVVQLDTSQFLARSEVKNDKVKKLPKNQEQIDVSKITYIDDIFLKNGSSSSVRPTSHRNAKSFELKENSSMKIRNNDGQRRPILSSRGRHDSLSTRINNYRRALNNRVRKTRKPKVDEVNDKKLPTTLKSNSRQGQNKSDASNPSTNNDRDERQVSPLIKDTNHRLRQNRRMLSRYRARTPRAEDIVTTIPSVKQKEERQIQAPEITKNQFSKVIRVKKSHNPPRRITLSDGKVRVSTTSRRRSRKISERVSNVKKNSDSKPPAANKENAAKSQHKREHKSQDISPRKRIDVSTSLPALSSTIAPLVSQKVTPTPKKQALVQNPRRPITAEERRMNLLRKRRQRIQRNKKRENQPVVKKTTTSKPQGKQANTKKKAKQLNASFDYDRELDSTLEEFEKSFKDLENFYTQPERHSNWYFEIPDSKEENVVYTKENEIKKPSVKVKNFSYKSAKNHYTSTESKNTTKSLNKPPHKTKA